MAEDTAPRTYKTRITAEEFLVFYLASDEEFEKLKEEGKVPEGVERSSEEDMIMRFQAENMKSLSSEKWTIIDSVEILDEIKISNKTDGYPSIFLKDSKLYGLTIDGCKLLNGDDTGKFYFNSSIVSFFHIENHSELSYFLIDKKSIAGDLNISNSSCSGFLINDNSHIGDLVIYDSSIEVIKIDNNSKAGDILIGGSTFQNIRFENQTIIGAFRMSNSYLLDFSLGNKCIMEDFSLYDSIVGDIEIGNNSITGDFYVNKTSTTGDFRITKSTMGIFTATNLYCSIFITSSNIQSISLFECCITEFRMILSCKLEAYISGGQVNLLNFSQVTLNKDTLLSFSKTLIYVVQLNDFSMLGNLYFREIRKALEIFNWYNIKETTPSLYKILQTKQKKSYEQKSNKLLKENNLATIYLAKSSLGKTEFTNCPLADFRIIYNNSKITDCFFMGGTVPEKNIEILGAEPGSPQEHEQKASIYNQFKKIFEAQGDLYRATQFQAKWADHQMKYLLGKRKEDRKLLKEGGKGRKFYFNENAQDVFTLWLNGFSNKHGESWLKALGWLLSFGLLFYVLFLWSMGRCFTSGHFDWNIAGYYFEYLNPLHKTNFINESIKINGGAVAIDFIGRLFVAYFIYQFVAAFRKHGKKQ